VIWELVNSCILGYYFQPYSDRKNLIFDFQILIHVAKRNLRPTIPPNCPDEIQELLGKMWQSDFESRPTCKEVISKLVELRENYLESWQTKLS
jgi:hypothetical protein